MEANRPTSSAWIQHIWSTGDTLLALDYKMAAFLPHTTIWANEYFDGIAFTKTKGAEDYFLSPGDT